MLPLFLNSAYVSMSLANDRHAFNVRRGHYMNISIIVTGSPFANVVLKKNAVDVGSDVYLRRDGIMQFGPLDESVTYSIVATNCFNSVSKSLFINVQSKWFYSHSAALVVSYSAMQVFPDLLTLAFPR